MHQIHSKLKTAFLFLALIYLSACEATVTTHGRLIEPADLDRLELGKTTMDQTISILGQPSFEGAFHSGRLYYNNQKMEQKVAGATTTIERELFVFTFDSNNVLQAIEIRDKTTDREIAKLKAKTPTPGDTLTIIDQIFTNLRRGNTGG